MGLLRGVNSEVSLRFYPFIVICINPITSGSNWLSETFHGNASFHSFLIIYYIIDLYFFFGWKGEPCERQEEVVTAVLKSFEVCSCTWVKVGDLNDFPSSQPAYCISRRANNAHS